MEARMPETLEHLLQCDEAQYPPPQALRRIEYCLALAVADGLDTHQWSTDGAVERLLASCRDTLPLATVLLRGGYPRISTPVHKLRARFVAWLGSGEAKQRERAMQILAAYQIDDEFVGQVGQSVSDLDQIHQYGEPGELAWIYIGGSAENRALFGRSVLLGLRRLWSEEESDEPILWRASSVLESIAENGSHCAVTDALARLVILGLVALVGESPADTLRDFLVQANDDANRNLLDNLVLAERTYRELVDGGWKPDRWEIENLPMTVNLYLKFMTQMGVKQTGEIGRRLQITLREAQEDYRYLGSPFTSSEEQKEVVVQTPGWTYRGELIVRPKVREVTQ